jgi:hypothetical protein
MYVCRRDVHFAKSVIVILDNEKRKNNHYILIAVFVQNILITPLISSNFS